jgi:hypothetical protein
MVLQRGLAWAVVFAAVGCSAALEDTGADDGHLETGGEKYPAFSYSMPQLVTGGGSVLANPRFVGITFDGDPMRSDLEGFIGRLAGSKYWKSIGADYGVGTATVGAPIHVADAPSSIEEGQIEDWLAGMLDGTHEDFGRPDPNAIYTIFYPPGTAIEQGGGVSCKDFGAFHGQTSVGDVHVAYAAIPRCESYATLTSTIGGIDFVTFSTSHELLEAATDPFGDAYNQVDDAHAIWGMIFNNEVGDLCARGQEWTSATDELGPAVQRMWSNTAAKAGHDPCIPSATRTYFNAVPVLPDQTPPSKLVVVQVPDDPATPQTPPPDDPDMPSTSTPIGTSSSSSSSSGTSGATDEVNVPPETDEGSPLATVTVGVGETKTIDVRLSSVGPTSGPWTVRAIDWDNRRGRGPETLAFAFDRTTGKNGDVLKLRITGKTPGSHPFLLVSTLDGASTYWPGMVLVPE